MLIPEIAFNVAGVIEAAWQRIQRDGYAVIVVAEVAEICSVRQRSLMRQGIVAIVISGCTSKRLSQKSFRLGEPR